MEPTRWMFTPKSKENFSRFYCKISRDDLPTQAAAIAFYAMSSLAPLAIVILAAASFLPYSSLDELTLRISTTLGRDWREALRLIYQGAQQSEMRSFAGVLATLLSLFLASSVLVQMRSVMDRIFEFEGTSIHAWALDRLIGGGLLLLMLFGFSLSMLASALLGVFESLSLQARLPLSGVLTTASSIVFLTILYRYLPRRRPAWSLCFQGGILCAFLLKLADSLFSHYVKFAAIKSSYGVAGTLVAFLLWIYASSFIFLLIAEVLYFLNQSKAYLWRSRWARLLHSRHPVLNSMLLGFLVVFILSRLMLPEIIRHRINHVFNHNEKWQGYLDEVDLALWRGFISLNGIHLQTKGKDLAVECAQASLNLSMHRLLWGNINLDLLIYQPEVVVRLGGAGAKGSGLKGVKAPLPLKQAGILKEIRAPWPVTFGHIEIKQGSLKIEDHTAQSLPTLRLSEIGLEGVNLSNEPRGGKGGPGLQFSAHTNGNGLLTGTIRINAIAPSLQFKTEMKLEHMSLLPLNIFFLKHAGLDLEKGEMSAFVELASAQGQVDGYIKPIFTDLKFIDNNRGKKNESFWRRLWEHVVQFSAEVIANKKGAAVALNIPLSGRLDDPRCNAFTAFVSLLRNGFIEALSRGFDRDLKSKPEFKPGAASRAKLSSMMPTEPRDSFLGVFS